MKVVCCKNCGAKYQLDDDDDISAFECSSCSGDLEVVENYSDDDNSSKSTIITSQKYDDSYIVQCSECGLKYKLNKNDNILDYECDSCGGPLRYLDENMNQEVDRYLEERKNEAPETVYEETDSADEYTSTEKNWNINLLQELQELPFHKQYCPSLEKNFPYLNQMTIMFWKNI